MIIQQPWGIGRRNEPLGGATPRPFRPFCLGKRPRSRLYFWWDSRFVDAWAGLILVTLMLLQKATQVLIASTAVEARFKRGFGLSTGVSHQF
mmetsp:Transcript_5988/g.12346  ORF Transcript_5988/g.12346 Transcript_5988/m.12346 type:complete len:92 (+) Transcript_5988:39-314(+)